MACFPAQTARAGPVIVMGSWKGVCARRWRASIPVFPKKETFPRWRPVVVMGPVW